MDEISGIHVAELTSTAVQTADVSPIGTKPSLHSIVCMVFLIKDVSEFLKRPFEGGSKGPHTATVFKKEIY